MNYSDYESLLITLYDAQGLTPSVLGAMLPSFRGLERDEPTESAQDGLTADDILIKTLRPKAWDEYQRRLMVLYASGGVTTFEEWNEQKHPVDSREWLEDREISNFYEQSWQDIIGG